MDGRTSRRGRVTASVVLGALSGTTLVATSATAATGDPVLINEIVVSSTGEDIEFVELFGTPGFSLNGLSVVQVEADADDANVGTLEDGKRIDFGPGDQIGASGYFLAGVAAVASTYDVTPDLEIPAATFENGSATYALVATADLPAGGALPSVDDVLDAIHLTDDDLDPAFLGAPSVGPDGESLPAGAARVNDGVDTDFAVDWAFADLSPPGGNTPTSGEVPPEPAAYTIMAIQGAGHLSPVVDELVVTSGVVTAVGSGGIYVQDLFGDGDDNTSDGIFVAGDELRVLPGDVVAVTGTVEEFIPGGADTGNLSITQLSSTDIAVIAVSALPLPVVIGGGGRQPDPTTVISADELPVNLQNEPGRFDPDNDAIDFWESLEGMFVEVDRPVTVSATQTFSATSSELFAIVNSGRGALSPPDVRTRRGGLELQPDPQNRGDQNPERIQIQFDGTLYPGPVPALPINTRLEDVRGVVGYSFGNFEVNATEEIVVFSESRLRPEVTPYRPTRTAVTVASYNVFNLAPDDTAQLATLGAHIATNLRGPDIVALQEVQDDSGPTNDGVVSADRTLAALSRAIEAAGGPAYVGVDVDPEDNTQGGVPGGNIRTAYLYNPARVELVELHALDSAYLTSVGAADPGAFEGARTPLLGVFEFRGLELTVINNHFSSRFGSSPVFGALQPFVQAGEDARAAQAQAVNDVVDRLLAVDPEANIAVVGDFNTFQWTDDLAEVLPGAEPVLTNLVTTRALNVRDRDDIYSFVFDGNSQLLDHMYVSDSLLAGPTRFDIVHLNVDFPRTDDGVGSDHEPLLARFSLR